MKVFWVEPELLKHMPKRARGFTIKAWRNMLHKDNNLRPFALLLPTVCVLTKVENLCDAV